MIPVRPKWPAITKGTAVISDNRLSEDETGLSPEQWQAIEEERSLEYVLARIHNYQADAEARYQAGINRLWEAIR